ncbi:MAG: tRNA epoxyqueuosine(34) reductase QueG [Deltaproteobacteria bacterium]|nr:tRNA epoxyqueuosine(34) reductase QueG [Deltaproteobacteria bacterium]MBW2137188.1 tRNA epoxyqueuosine(34) reductase QueG [Deltaproteobacteria bacterium]
MVRSLLTERARELGFISIGFVRPQRPPFFDQYMERLSQKKHGDMSWLERGREIREAPQRLLQGCKTIICLAFPYSAEKPATRDGFTLSRYSQPDLEDYHVRLKTLCGSLVDVLEEHWEGCKNRVCVDSVPLMERSVAYAAGMGFFGKNNMLIIPGYGSYFYLAEILTTAPLETGETRPMESQCGDCRQCVANCPTGALRGPYTLDASRCLSYLTIEYKGELDHESGTRMAKCFFGCDRCQEVCPFNGDEGASRAFLPSTREFLEMDESVFEAEFGRTALSRAGLRKIKSNIMAVTNAER